MSFFPEIKNYGNSFDKLRHDLKFRVSWHEIIEKEHFVVYAIVAYQKGRGLGKKLVKEIEELAKNQN